MLSISSNFYGLVIISWWPSPSHFALISPRVCESSNELQPASEMARTDPLDPRSCRQLQAKFSWSRELKPLFVKKAKKNCNFFCGSEDVDTRKLSQFYQRFTPQFTRIHVCKNWWKRIHRIKRVPDFQQGSSCSMVTFTTTWLKRKCSRSKSTAVASPMLIHQLSSSNVLSETELQL